jgi:hypothetical protein
MMDRASLDRLFSQAAERLKREDDALRQTIDRIDETERLLRVELTVSPPSIDASSEDH